MSREILLMIASCLLLGGGIIVARARGRRPRATDPAPTKRRRR